MNYIDMYMHFIMIAKGEEMTDILQSHFMFANFKDSINTDVATWFIYI